MASNGTVENGYSLPNHEDVLIEYVKVSIRNSNSLIFCFYKILLSFTKKKEKKISILL